ncbi:MAG: hypothetical protein QF437_21975 [Planctomycetota bacterium]|jgi:hypothetical protein|nr:hypothetical protein [Planctomycetota bacterium]MDP7133180.1 hypothetical protein [Planctomycetota bacterium]
MYDAMIIKGDKITIAGADGDFRMAYARITGKDTVEVWHHRVPEPKHVRFAWHRNPLHNLYNKENFRHHPSGQTISIFQQEM